MRLNKNHHLRLRQSAASDPHCEFFDGIVIGDQFMIIDQQKQFRRGNRDSFVAVDEGVIGAQVEEVGCRLFRWIRVQFLATERRSRHCDGRFEKPPIPEPRIATKFLDYTPMAAQHIFDGQESDEAHY